MRVAKLYEGAHLPTRKHPNDAGMDLYAYIPKVLGEGVSGPDQYSILLQGGVAIFQTGITVEIPDGFVGLIWPKSRSDFLIGGGVVDAGYQGEILVKIITTKSIEIHDGDAIAQMVIVPVLTPPIYETHVDEIHAEKTARGATGGILMQGVSNLELEDQELLGTWDA